MKIAICEDQIIQINLLNNKIKKWSDEKGVRVSIDNFKSAESFLFKWEDYDKYDIIFLDIKLSQMSGLELSNLIREKNKSVKIVFVTGIFKLYNAIPIIGPPEITFSGCSVKPPAASTSSARFVPIGTLKFCGFAIAFPVTVTILCVNGSLFSTAL